MKTNGKNFFAVSPALETCLLVFGCLILGGAVSLLLGRDVSTDPFVYTLYSAHAFFTGRTADIFAAGTAPALNPLLYLPYYLTFVKLNDWPLLSLFLNGVPYGLFVFFVWKICSRAFENQGKIIVLTFTSLAVTGSSALACVGSGNGALWLAALEACSCWLLFYARAAHVRKWAFVPVLAAVGLHFSAAPAAVGLLAAACVLRGERKQSFRRQTAVYALLGFCFVFLAAVWYAWRMGTLDMLGSFFWPPGWASPWAVKWEMPLVWQEWLFLPVWRLRYALPGFQVDPRLACGLVCTVILLGKHLFENRKERSLHETAWSVFFLGAYIGWLLGWRDAASSILLEFAGVLLLARCLVWGLGARAGVLAAAVLLWVICAPVLPEGRQGAEEHNFAFFKEPVLTEKPLVLLAGPLSGWVPFLPQEARYAGGVWFDLQDYAPAKHFSLHRINLLPRGFHSHRRDDAVRSAVRAHGGDVYVLIPNDGLTLNPAVWRRYGVEVPGPLTECQSLYPASWVGATEFLLCRAQKISVEK